MTKKRKYGKYRVPFLSGTVTNINGTNIMNGSVMIGYSNNPEIFRFSGPIEKETKKIIEKYQPTVPTIKKSNKIINEDISFRGPLDKELKKIIIKYKIPQEKLFCMAVPIVFARSSRPPVARR